ncbi:MAG: hypothetical protein JWL97_4423 [Gemmatimonadales bacterium]|jgi:hypothetical protein|nr:hypothetical protein [Gemmatimonadales bacterium]
MNVEVDDGIYERQHCHEIHELLNETHTLINIRQYDTTLTFRNSEETKEHNAVAMCSPDIVVYITDR